MEGGREGGREGGSEGDGMSAELQGEKLSTDKDKK
jgi:hypothetical protein